MCGRTVFLANSNYSYDSLFSAIHLPRRLVHFENCEKFTYLFPIVLLLFKVCSVREQSNTSDKPLRVSHRKRTVNSKTKFRLSGVDLLFLEPVFPQELEKTGFSFVRGREVF